MEERVPPMVTGSYNRPAAYRFCERWLSLALPVFYLLV